MAASQVATAVSAATSGTNCWGENFGYDIWGNLLSRAAGQGGSGCTYEPLTVAATTKNQISGFCYDAAGNLTRQAACGSTDYTYDAENRITSTAGVTYTVACPERSRRDGDGQRVKKSTGTLYYYIPGTDSILQESDLAGNTRYRYVFFNGKRIVRRNSSSGEILYYFSDHLGSSNVVTNATGTTIKEESDFYPFGGERVLTDTVSDQQYKFTGKERDTESNLDYFGARYYSSNLGRFTTPDEFPGGPVDAFSSNDPAPPGSLPYADITNPQSLNKYSYALNNPLRFVDPEGHAPQCATCKTEYANETKKGGTKNWRNNNPGNIKYGEFAKQNGAIGHDKDGFAIFPDQESGKSAQENLLDTKSYRELSVTDATKRWTAGDPPEVQKQYAEDLAKAAGVGPGTKLKDMTPEQRQKLTEAQKNREGYKEGKTTPKKSAEEPAVKPPVKKVDDPK